MGGVQVGIQSVPLHGLVDMTNEQYHNAPGISNSHLSCIATRSPMHYWAKYIDPDRDRGVSTPAQILGQAIHIAILEPDLMEENVVCGLEIDRRSNANKAEWKAFEAEHAHQIIVPSEKYADVRNIRDAVHRHPVAHGLLQGGRAEQTFFATERIQTTDATTGEITEEDVLIKCRTDYLHDSGRMIVDVKSTEDASPTGFGKSAANYRYDVQNAWYNGVFDALYGEHPENWVFLAFEKDPPYAVGVYYTTPEQVARAAVAARRDFMRIVECRRAQHWPDYGFDIQELQLPGWMKR